MMLSATSSSASSTACSVAPSPRSMMRIRLGGLQAAFQPPAQMQKLPGLRAGHVLQHQARKAPTDSAAERRSSRACRPGRSPSVDGQNCSSICRRIRHVSSEMRSRTTAPRWASLLTVARSAWGCWSSNTETGSTRSIAGSCSLISSTTKPGSICPRSASTRNKQGNSASDALSASLVSSQRHGPQQPRERLRPAPPVARARKTARPRGSANRRRRAAAAHRRPTFSSSVIGATGPSESTHVSLLRWPSTSDKRSESSDDETRVKPPGITA